MNLKQAVSLSRASSRLHGLEAVPTMNLLTLGLQIVVLGLIWRIHKTLRSTEMAIEDIEASEASTAESLGVIAEAIADIAADEQKLLEQIQQLNANTVTPEQLETLAAKAADNAAKAKAAADAMTNLASQVE